MHATDVVWGTSDRWHDAEAFFDVSLLPDAQHATKSPGGRAKARKPRSTERSYTAVVMTHLPTGVEVHGQYWGYDNRKEQSNAFRRLLQHLFVALEEKVAKSLRIPGR